jgi:hypothetical protein
VEDKELRSHCLHNHCLRKFVREERLYKALYDEGIELTGSYHMFPSVGPREPIATKLLAMTEGTIGELSTLLKSAAIYAVRTGAERIDASVLAGLEWEPPSARHAPSLGHV